MTTLPDPAPVTRPNRQRERTRKALISAGQTLFAVRPVEGVTVDDIVDAANVAKGSFYNHFNDKDELAGAIYNFVQTDVEREIASVNEGVADSPTRIARALCTVTRYALEHPERLKALLSMAGPRRAVDSPLNAGVVADVGGGIDQGRLCGIDLECGVLCVIGIIQTTVRHAMSGDAHSAPADLATGMGGSLLQALGLPHEEARALSRAAADALLGDAS
ncbi:MAG TPA: TetR/AcrR family transcriptional regulator [Sphingomonas sp.]|nr:TetR/AcrR family transcriptional regulator [Sphingomonas sp.]